MGPPRIESLRFLPPASIANLIPVGSYVILKMSRFKQDTSIGTTRFRQAVYLSRMRRMLIPDPVGQDRGYTFIVACFIEQLMHNHNSQSTTVYGYIRSINIFFQLHNCTILVDLSDKENICTKIVKAREQEEDIARQRSPITNEIFAEILNNSQANALQDSFEVVMCGFLIIIRLLGLLGLRVRTDNAERNCRAWIPFRKTSH